MRVNANMNEAQIDALIDINRAREAAREAASRAEREGYAGFLRLARRWTTRDEHTRVFGV